MSINSESKIHYRADIQGLRGIAVLLVVVYHTGFALPGGFIGVDMFFVISGFVITQVLVREHEETGRISLRGFYFRRAHRLIPALSVVVIFTLFFSIIAMSPFGEQQQIIKTAIASTFFAGNIHLFAMDSYEALKDNPLRHLWSLGVEEQFYWAYPMFFIAIRRIATNRFKRILTITLSIFALLSFATGVLLTYGFEFGYYDGSASHVRLGFLEKIGFYPGGDWPTKFAFFGAPARFWEILLGSFLALSASKFVFKVRNVAVVFLAAGISLIFWSSFALSPRSEFPGYLALMPTLGTVFVVLSNRQVRPINSFLTSSRLVYFGDISYSLYLWHWPFIVFSRAIWPGASIAPLIAAALSVFPATISYKFIEARFRKDNNFKDRNRPLLIALLMVFPLVVSFITLRAANTGLGIPIPESKWSNFATQNDCGDGNEFWEVECVFGDSEPSFTSVLIGDSNARSASDGVIAAVRALGGELLISVKAGCPLGENSRELDCQRLNQKRFLKLQNSRPDFVVLVSNYTAYLGAFSEAQVIGSLEETLDFLSKNNIPAIVQGQIPDCLSQSSLIRLAFKVVYHCETSLASQITRNRLLVASRILTLRSEKNIFVDPTETICTKSECNARVDGRWVFSDTKHLSPTGSRMLTPIFVEAMRKVLASSRP